MVMRLVQMLRPHAKSIALGLVFLLLATPMQMFHPLVWMFVVDEVIPARRFDWLVWAVVVMVLVHGAGTLLSALRTYLLGLAGQRFVADLRNAVHAKLMGQSLAFFHERRSGDLVARTISDVDTLEEMVLNGVDTIVANALSFLVVGGIIVWLHPVVGTLTLVPLGVVAAMVWFFNSRVKGLYRRIRDRLGDLSGHLQEHLSGIAIIKAFARESHDHALFRSHNARYMRESFRGVAARSFYFPGVLMIGFISNAVMIGLGGYFVLMGTMSIGVLIAYRGYWWQLFSPVFGLAQTNEMLQRARAASARVFELLDAPESVRDAPDALPMPEAAGHVAFDQVRFGYQPDRLVLDGVSFEIQPGQRLGIAGPSGGGKSTLLGLAMRFYDPTGGAVRLDGHDLRRVRQLDFRRYMALVAQDAFLFNDTIRANIRFGRLEASDSEIEAAAQFANAHDFVVQLPNGYGTIAGERGVKLSGGQKQRICIARAFLANPRILLLDEATAAVEPESEAVIQAALERLMEGRTTIIVAHRLSLVRDCDTIIVVKEGRIAERGSHDELMRAGGWYQRMYSLQTDGAVGDWAVLEPGRYTPAEMDRG